MAQVAAAARAGSPTGDGGTGLEAGPAMRPLPRPLALLLLALTASSAAGCNPEGGSVGERMRECGFLSDGEVRRLPGGLYLPDGCYEACYREASCDELADAICRVSTALAIRCDARCAFRCPSGGIVATERVCDGTEHCPMGEDEEGCPTPGDAGTFADLRCTRATRCDGFTECADGSDEEGCPVHTCGDGRELRGTVRCDGFENCPDGSDEAGCATQLLTCM